MEALLRELRLGFVALQFLTRVPSPRWVGFEPEWLNASARHFPLVGALVGAVGAAVLLSASMLWPPVVAALLALAATVSITGAFHEDGLADTLDALGGTVPRERALAIMKDSRIGSYGAVALIVVLGTRVALMASLCAGPWPLVVAAMVLSHALGRAGAVTLMALLPYAGDAEHAKAKPLATAIGPVEWTTALAWGFGLVAVGAGVGAFSPGRALAVLVLAASVPLLMRHWLRRRLGGYTGDTLGAAEQFTEVAALLALCAV
ncbi:adenosylcobinamide-GDP ribazoletransferase [Ideonella sp. YS5]|uniref:adenosylcobinamide-GDP ribazoletransferase n=1 Tax=Ideonella sp. YS5 TaxID=3453714 RepID=UPI003EEF2404